MSDQGLSGSDQSRRDIPSFIEPQPPLITNPFMRPKPQKGTNLMELFEDSEVEDPDWVQVYLRLKPCDIPSSLYEVKNDRNLISSVDTATAGHGRRTQHNVSKMYTFSHIFGPESTQKEIFEQVVKENLRKLPEGYNFTLLTYGASGSGKTYTLMGTVASPGLVPRSLEYMFRIVDAAQHPVYKPSEEGAERLGYNDQDIELQWVRRLRHVSAPLRDKYRRMSAQLRNDMTSTLDLSNRTRYYVWVSFVEIYNESIYDLLANTDRSKATSKLRIREDSSGNVYVKGATQAFVRSGSEAYDVMVYGKHNLQVAATGVHAHSSRSHCIFTITLLTETESGVRTSYIRLCDLAGSERARVTRNTGARMLESRAINSSLHVLERCLHALRRRQHGADNIVPYRESKLTRLLGAGLSGAKGEAISMVVTLNPSPQYTHETKHVLQLAAVARDIQINQTMALTESTFESTQDSTVEVSAELMKLRADNERLHFELIQAQNHIKELQASMAEKQQETAKTMSEYVEQAKKITATYYESQLQLVKQQMEDMKEEYETQLKAAELSLTGTEGTPSKSLQKKVAQLMLQVTLLQEKLSEEKLARERTENEVQHLRACIDERDEKDDNSPEPNQENEIIESETEESEADSCSESLEPTFKREDINRSIQLLKNPNKIKEDSVSLKQLGINKANYTTIVDTTIVNADVDVTLDSELDDNDHDSVLETSNDLTDDHNLTRKSIETTQDASINDAIDEYNVKRRSNEVIQATEADAQLEKDNNAQSSLSNYDELKNTHSSLSNYEENTNESTYVTGESNNSEKFDEIHSNYISNEDIEIGKGIDKLSLAPNENGKSESENRDLYDKTKQSDCKNSSNNSLTRGTYFVRQLEPYDKSQIDLSKNNSLSNSRETYFIKTESVDADDEHESSTKLDQSKNASRSNSRETYFIETESVNAEDEHKSSTKHDQSKNASLSSSRDTYFVKDKVINNEETEKNSSLTRGTYFVKGTQFEVSKLDKSNKAQKSHTSLKSTYFDRDREIIDDIVNKSDLGENMSSNDKELTPKDDKRQEFKSSKDKTSDDIRQEKKVEEILSERVVNKLLNQKRQILGSDISLKQFEMLEKASNVIASSEKKLSDASHTKINKDKTYFDYDSKHPEDQNQDNKITDLVKDKMLSHKKTYFENMGITCGTNLNDERSPSIVKDDAGTNFEPSTIKKLLGESFTRPDMLQKVVLPTKHQSMDIFEGFDSPGLVKAKFDAEISKKNAKVDVTGNKSLEKHSYVDKNDSELKKKPSELIDAKIDYSKVIIKQEKMDSVSIFDTCIEKNMPKDTINTDSSTSSILESIRQCKENNQKGKDIKIKVERTSVSKILHNDDVAGNASKSSNITMDNTIDEFEKIAVNATARPSEFEFLIPQKSFTETRSKKEPQTQITDKSKEFENIKYNLLHNIADTEIRKQKPKITEKVTTDKTKEFENVKYNLRHIDDKKKVDKILATKQKCIADLLLNQMGNVVNIKADKAAIEKYFKTNESDNKKTLNVASDPTVQKIDNIVKDLPLETPKTNSFDNVLKEISNAHNSSSEEFQPKKEKQSAKTKEFEQVKYNLRHKPTYIETKSEKKLKRTLRLRKGKPDYTENPESETSTTSNEANESAKLKDIVNLQQEFSDVTLDVPASKKDVKDIPSPEKGQEENLPPQHLGIQSCPSKSVTRSRRKLFTPLAEPLEESFPSGGSTERVRVPRPSYHKPRARRRL